MAFLCRVSLVFLHNETWNISIWKPSTNVSVCVFYARQCSNNIEVYTILFVYGACTVVMEFHCNMNVCGNLVLRTALCLYSVFEYKLLICVPHIVKS